jgi:hypothetical protein
MMIIIIIIIAKVEGKEKYHVLKSQIGSQLWKT